MAALHVCVLHPSAVCVRSSFPSCYPTDNVLLQYTPLSGCLFMVCILGGMRSTICVSLYESEVGCIGRVAHQSMLHGLMVRGAY